MGTAFWLRSARHAAPIVELPLLRVPAFAVGTLAALLFTVAFAAMLLTSVLWCQEVWGYSAIRTGLAIAPGPLVVPALAVASGGVSYDGWARGVPRLWGACCSPGAWGGGPVRWVRARATRPSSSPAC